MMTTTAELDTATRTVSPQAAPNAAQTGELTVRLIFVVLHGKPRRAIVAFRALTILCKLYRETHARSVELSRIGRPAIAAAAASALVQATLARKR